MRRLSQALVWAGFLALCWQLMLVAHEAGHVIGAWLTGGRVTRVVLWPGAISRTDVDPNPHPRLVVWSGPVGGVLIPALLAACVPRRRGKARQIAMFFAGFCLIANGVYIAGGIFLSAGDGDVMRRTGTPPYAMVTFGLACTMLGLWLWHRLGSMAAFWRGLVEVKRRGRADRQP